MVCLLLEIWDIKHRQIILIKDFVIYSQSPLQLFDALTVAEQQELI